MHTLKNCWYAVLNSKELSPDRPTGVRLGSKHYAIFRTAGGGISALSNDCPHQGASLSGGSVIDGCIRCPYHHWQFDGGGRCISRPTDPHAPVRQLDHATSWSVKEQDDFIWLFYGVPAMADQFQLPKLITPPGAGRWATISGVFKFAAHINRVMLNGTDISHVPMVHALQFGNALEPETPRYHLQYHQGGAAAAVSSTAPSTPQQLLLSHLALSGDMTAVARASFWMPNVTALEIKRGGKTAILVSAHIPIEEGGGVFRTDTHWIFHRNFLTAGVFDMIFWRAMNQVFEADAKIVNQQRPQVFTEAMLDAPTAALPSDRLGLYYRRLLKESMLANQINL